MPRLLLASVLMLIGFGMGAGTSEAAPVNIDGGFTSFFGVVGSGNVPLNAIDTQTTINGTPITPSAPLPFNGSPWSSQDFVAPNTGSATAL